MLTKFRQHFAKICWELSRTAGTAALTAALCNEVTADEYEMMIPEDESLKDDEEENVIFQSYVFGWRAFPATAPSSRRYLSPFFSSSFRHILFLRSLSSGFLAFVTPPHPLATA